MRRASGKGNPPSAKSPNVSPPIVRAVTAANAAIRGFDFHERSGGAWASSFEASAAISAGLNVAPRLDGLALLPALFLLRATTRHSLQG